jgi:hypothetical protein
MAQTMMARLARSMLAASAAVLALQVGACADLPATSGPPPKVKAPDVYQDERSFASPASDWPTDRWWDAYGDTQLSGLIDEALKGSPTLAQAEARLISAGAATQVSRAALLPSIHGEGQVSETEYRIQPDRRLSAVHPGAAAAGLHRQRPPGARRLLRPRPVRQEPGGAESVGLRPSRRRRRSR